MVAAEMPNGRTESGMATGALNQGGKKMDNENATNTQDNANTTPNVQAGNNNQKSEAPAIDYDKIESMIAKGTQQKESAILKSYFEQNGMSEEEARNAIGAYKESKAKQAEESKNAYASIKAENDKLKQELIEGRINSKAQDVALNMGVSSKSVPYLIRMADMSGAVNDKGEIAEDAIKAAFESVLKDVPGLKGDKEEAKGFVLGANNNTGDGTGTSESDLRKLFGVKSK